MTILSESIKEAEERVRLHLYDQHPKMFFSLPSEVYEVMSAILAAQGEVSGQTITESDIVCRNIFVRLMQDLRSAFILASSGYSLQSATICSAICELAFEIGYIGKSEEKAVQWIEHNNIEAVRVNWFNRMENVVKIHEKTAQEARIRIDEEKKVYTNLCAAKHGNPLVQQHFGFVSYDYEGGFTPTPQLDPMTVDFSAFSIYHACRLCLIASQAFLDNHVHPLQAHSVNEMIVSITPKIYSEYKSLKVRLGLQE